MLQAYDEAVWTTLHCRLTFINTHHVSGADDRSTAAAAGVEDDDPEA